MGCVNEWVVVLITTHIYYSKMFLILENTMKRIIGLVLVSLFFVGCGETLNQPQDTSMFEKRTPVTNRDSVKNRVPLQRALECLNLTREQRLIIDSILREEKICSIECKKELNEGIKTLREDYKAKMEKYRGVKKTPEIKKEIEILTFEFRQTQRDLEREYRTKMEQCIKNTFIFIEAILRKDQLTLWNLWKATGKIPCDRVKP